MSPRRSAKSVKSSLTSGARPFVPTLMCGSYKGGVGKTTMAIAIAERLFDVGLKVLLVAVDPQMDAARRLHVRATPGKVTNVTAGDRGKLDILTLSADYIVDVLYRNDRLTRGYDCVVVDTPVEKRFGNLPGLLLWVPIDGLDALQNAVGYLRGTPESTQTTLYASRRGKVTDLEELSSYLPDVAFMEIAVPDCDRIEQAHRKGKSVWSVSPRRGRLVGLLDVANTAAHELWSALPKAGRPPWSEPSSAGEEGYFFKGWDN